MAELVRHYLISGRVQGVGYRAFAADRARSLDLRGWTRNLSDGRVEIVACAAVEALDRFAEDLRRGPTHAAVTGLVVADWPADRHPSNVGFDVRKDAPAPCSASSAP